MSLRKKLIIGLLSLVLIILSFSDRLDRRALSFVADASIENSICLDIIAKVETAISGQMKSKNQEVVISAKHILTVLDKVEGYLMISATLLELQTVLLKLTQTIAFKIIPIVLLIVFIVRTDKNNLWFLMVGIMMSSGIMVYVNAIEQAGNVMGITITSDTKKELEQMEEKIQKLNISLPTDASNSTATIEAEIKNVVKEIEQDLSGQTSRFSFRMVIDSLIIFLLLPALYCFVLYKLWRKQINEEKQIVMLIVLAGGAVFLFFMMSHRGHKADDSPSKDSITVPSPSLRTGTSGIKHMEMGIDVSHYNGVIDWQKVKAQKGVEFVYVQASNGDNKDAQFADNWTQLDALNIPRGAYHYFTPSMSGHQQANIFINTIGRIEINDLPPMVDLEVINISAQSTEAYQKSVIEWLKVVEKNYRKKPIIYTNGYFASKYLQDSAFAAYPLWIAETEVREPTVPKPWNTYAIWQYSFKGSIEGIQGDVDCDSLAVQWSDLN